MKAAGVKQKLYQQKKLAEHFKQIKYPQLNSDVFTGMVVAYWQQMVNEYREAKKVQGVTEGTLFEIVLSLRHFERIIGKCNSKQINQKVIDKFMLQRGGEVKRPALNKDIRNLRIFINWCREKRYLNGTIGIKELKEDEKPVKSLNNDQIKKLLVAAKKYPTIKMRILLALGTGLRRGDIDSLKVSDIDFINNYITTTSKKTRKSMGAQPVPAMIIQVLKNYLNGSSSEKKKIFDDKFIYKKWKKICKKSKFA